jgi:hypothetical protein
VIALFQRLLSQPFPAFWPIGDLGSLERNIQVSTFNSKVESRIFVLNEMECNLQSSQLVSNQDQHQNKKLAHLGEPLLLQVGDDALAQQCRCANDVKHFLIVIAQQRKLESILSWIECDCPWTCRAIQAVDSLAFDTCKVDWVIQSANYAVVTVHSRQ